MRVHADYEGFMVNKNIDKQQLKAKCDVLAETNLGYMKIASDGKWSNGYIYHWD